MWSQAELPCDGQTVALLISAVENPKEFYCRINNPTGLVYLSSLCHNGCMYLSVLPDGVKASYKAIK